MAARLRARSARPPLTSYNKGGGFKMSEQRSCFRDNYNQRIFTPHTHVKFNINLKR